VHMRIPLRRYCSEHMADREMHRTDSNVDNRTGPRRLESLSAMINDAHMCSRIGIVAAEMLSESLSLVVSAHILQGSVKLGNFCDHYVIGQRC
jgi:hypothetical protein